MINPSFIWILNDLVNKYFQDEHTFYVLAVSPCDQILWSQNKLNFENISSSLTMDINWIFSSHSDAWKSKLNPCAPSWEPPPLGWVKFNFDATITPITSFLSTICHYSNGSLLLVKSKWDLFAEAKMAVLVVSTAANLDLIHAIFESDAKTIIDLIKSPSSTPLQDIMAVIVDI